MRRLRDENALLFLIDQVTNYLNEYKEDEKMARVAMIKIEYLYCKNDSVYAQIKSKITAEDQLKNVYFPVVAEDDIAKLVEIIIKHGA